MKTVEERMKELAEAAEKWTDYGLWKELYPKVAQHLTQQAAEAQIALKEAVEADRNSGEWIPFTHYKDEREKHKKEMDTTAVELKTCHELVRQKQADIDGLMKTLAEYKNLAKDRQATIDGLKKELAKYHAGERCFLAASCKECGAALQPEDIMVAIRHKGMCPNAARQHCWQTGPLPIMVNNWDDLTSPAKVVSDGWRKFCEAQGKPANVQETLDRALGRLDEVEAKLKLVIGMVLDEDRRRL